LAGTLLFLERWGTFGLGQFFMQAKNDIGPAGDPDTLVAMVAEDDVLVRLSLAEYLREAGFQVLEAANGEEGRKIVGSMGGVDVVISDVHMKVPGEGFALARWIGEHYPQIPVILTSGSKGAAQSPELATCRNVTDFVVKPYSERQLERLARTRIEAQGATSG
jgi:DNA-binding NtrC family response regulator